MAAAKVHEVEAADKKKDPVRLAKAIAIDAGAGNMEVNRYVCTSIKRMNMCVSGLLRTCVGPVGFSVQFH